MSNNNNFENTAPAGPGLDSLAPSDPERRRFLTAAATVVGGLGVAAAAVPFIESMEPSARSRAGGAPVTIDIGGLKPGQMLSARWRQKPVWVLRRTKDQLAELPKLNDRLKDPMSKELQQPPNLPHWDPVQRSIKPEYLLVVGICTHLGCIPGYRPQPGAADLGATWPGGFFCPCHGSRYDLSGRVMDGSPAPLNLPVIPHYYRKDNVIVAGELEDGSESNWSPNTW